MKGSDILKKVALIVIASFILAIILIYVVPFITYFFTMQDLNAVFQLAMFILLVFILREVTKKK